MDSVFLLMPATGALIGWLTNWLAIKSLFHPRQSIRLGPIKLQGVVPKRQKELAASIGQIVEEELVTVKDLTQRLQDEPVKDHILGQILVQVEEALTEKLPRLVRPLGTELIMPVIRREASQLLDKLLTGVESFITEEAKVKELVEQKVNTFDFSQLEHLVQEVAGRELKHIEILGGVLGALIGIVQAFLTLYI